MQILSLGDRELLPWKTSGAAAWGSLEQGVPPSRARWGLCKGRGVLCGDVGWDVVLGHAAAQADAGSTHTGFIVGAFRWARTARDPLECRVLPGSRHRDHLDMHGGGREQVSPASGGGGTASGHPICLRASHPPQGIPSASTLEHPPGLICLEASHPHPHWRVLLASSILSFSRHPIHIHIIAFPWPRASCPPLGIPPTLSIPFTWEHPSILGASHPPPTPPHCSLQPIAPGSPIPASPNRHPWACRMRGVPLSCPHPMGCLWVLHVDRKSVV